MSATASQRQVRFAALALAAALLVILVATLMPFRAAPRALALSAFLGTFVWLPSSPFDFPRNILLFMPLGASLAALLDARGVARPTTRALTFLAALGLTVLVESLQYFLPGRQPNVADIVANTLGGLLGLGSWRLWQMRATLLPRLARWLTPKRALSVTAVYLFLILALTLALRSSVTLRTWDPDFPLLLGNERTGSRVWKGRLADLAIADRAATPTEAARLVAGEPALAVMGTAVRAAYPLRGPDGLTDASGHLPPLTWRGTEQPPAPRNDGTDLGADGWLATEEPLTALSQRLQQTDQFTVSLQAAAAQATQEGPARIVSISRSAYARNLTLGQEGSDLIIRLRTPLGKRNGTVPELVVEDMFAGTQPQRIVVTYDQGRMTVYGTAVLAPRYIDLAPGIALVAYLVSHDYWDIPLTPVQNWFYWTFYGVFTLLPPALLWLLVRRRAVLAGR